MNSYTSCAKKFFKSAKHLKESRLFFIGLALLVNIPEIMAQQNTFKGEIINEAGETIPNVSIEVPARKQSYIASSKGQFELPFNDPGTILIFSCVGYETIEHKVGNNERYIRIVLKGLVKDLEAIEIVSTGYQDIPRERSTGSFYKINNATLNQQVGLNILKRLDGVSSGLLFETNKSNPNNANSALNISIRGLSTINGSLDPLIVLDGFIYEGDINNLNPNDIENVNILKDAAAASIWGARAGNGVIIINTKKGRFNQKTSLEFNSTVIISEKPNLYYLPQMTSGEYVDFEEFLFNQGYFDSQISNPYQALTPAIEVLLKRRNNLISFSDSADQINYLKSVDSRDQYNKFFYTQAVRQQYALNLRGGTNNNSYLFSVGYDRSLSETYVNYKKLNVRIENEFKPARNLSLNLGVYYTNSTSNSGRQATFNSIKIGGREVPYLEFADNSGNPFPVSTIYRGDYTDTAGGGKLFDWKYYPLTNYKHEKTKSNIQEIFANIGLKYKLFSFLDFDIKYQYQNQVNQTEQNKSVESFTARNTINLFSQIDYAGGAVNYIVPTGGIRTLGTSNIESQTGRGQLNFIYSWKNNEIIALAGSEIRNISAKGESNTTYGFNPDPLTFSRVDFYNTYPTFVTGNFEAISGSPSSSFTIDRFVSVFGNALYSYRRKYSISISGRKDASNIFGVSTNDKWKPLWSAGLSWKLSNESFYKSNLVPAIKLRVTYGHSGNVALNKSALAVADYFASNTFNLSFARIQTLNNPSLRWEQTALLNFGIDFSFARNVFNGSLEYYVKKSSDLYGNSPYDYTTWGYSRDLTRNVALMKGNGIDIILNSRNIDKLFKWTTTLLFSYNENKTTKYNSVSAKNIITILGGGNTISPVIGKPLYAIAAYKWGGLDNAGNPQGYVNGQLSTNYLNIFNEGRTKGLEGNINYVGSASPKLFGSITNSFGWKGFLLSANINFKAGYYFRKSTLSYSGLIANGSGHSEYTKRWKAPGDEFNTNVPSFIYPVDANRDVFYSYASINVLKADHVRLQYINLSYTFNKLKHKLPVLSQIQLYANASNLGIIWKVNKEGLDPDYPDFIYPVRSWAFGLRASF